MTFEKKLAVTMTREEISGALGNVGNLMLLTETCGFPLADDNHRSWFYWMLKKKRNLKEKFLYKLKVKEARLITISIDFR